MALPNGSRPFRLSPAFVTQIALLICTPSVFSSALSEPNLKPLTAQTYPGFAHLTLLRPKPILTHVPTREHSQRED